MPQPDSGDNCCDCPSRASPCDSCGGGGACCIDGVCSILSAADCASGGGNYLGDGSICGGVDCTIGACCDQGGVCDDITEAECNPINHHFFGYGTKCADDPCPIGACCTANLEVCSQFGEDICGVLGDACPGGFQVSEWACIPDPSHSARWLGAGVSCDECETPNFVCCDPSLSCCFEDPDYFCGFPDCP